MARKKDNEPKKVERAAEQDDTVYSMCSPLWSKYYTEVRKRIRFPRYYKKAVNW